MDTARRDELVTLLERLLHIGQVGVDTPTRERYAHDDAEWAPYAAPLGVVFAESTEDVASVVSFAGTNGLSVVARGAGTGLSGGANSVEDCIVLSLERMTAVLEVNADERYAIAQAGVINNELRQVVAESGLWYPRTRPVLRSVRSAATRRRMRVGSAA